MMLRTLYLKSIRDRWVGVTVAVVSLFLVVWMGLWAYSGVDEADTYLQQMPDEMVAMLGITRDSGTTGLMFSTMFSFLAPFVFAGLALSMGASAIAGEERDGTMNVLTSAPRSRGRMLWSKAMALLTLMLIAAVAMWLSYEAAAQLSGADASSLNLGAATVQMTVVSLFYGALALAIGAGTGNRGTASGIATALVVVSFLGAGLMPLFEGWEDGAKIFPWYYIDASQPMINGVDWAPMAVLGGISVVLVLGGWWGLVRRDLRAGGGHTSLLERLKQNDRLAALLARVQGKGSTRGIITKSLSDQRTVTTIVGASFFFFLVAMGPMFKALGDTLGDVVDSMPDALLAMIGYADYSTATGWYHGEAMAIYGPLMISIVAIGAGAALVREERRRTIGVLLSVPLSRASIALRKLAAMAILAATIGVIMFAGISLGNGVANLGMDVGNIVAAAVLLTALGLMIGSSAYFFGGLFGTHSAAVWGGTGVAVAGWAINMFVGVNPDLEWFAKISPFYWLLEGYPLDNGMDWTALAVLTIEAAVLASVGLWAYTRRDLRG